MSASRGKGFLILLGRYFYIFNELLGIFGRCFVAVC